MMFGCSSEQVREQYVDISCSVCDCLWVLCACMVGLLVGILWALGHQMQYSLQTLRSKGSCIQSILHLSLLLCCSPVHTCAQQTHC